MVFGAEPSEWQIQLGGEHEDRQPGLQRERAIHQSHSHRHRDQGHPERRRQLQHGPRQKADPERFHGRGAVALADLADRDGLIVRASEGAQRGQSPDHVKEVVREPAQRLPPRFRSSLGVAADQHHEHGHQRQCQQHDQGRLKVDDGHPREHQERDARGEHDLGQVTREVAFQRLDPLHRDGGDLGSFGTVGRGRLRPQTLLDQRQSKLGQDAPCSAAAGELHPPRECASERERGHEQAKEQPEGVGRHAVERTGDDQREQAGLSQNGQRGTDP